MASSDSCRRRPGVESKCKFWLPKKKRFCAIPPLPHSQFCGNHTKRSDEPWVPCPIDPSHSVLETNLESHIKRCPLLKRNNSLSLQPFYQKGINGGTCSSNQQEEEEEDNGNEDASSELKRMAVHSMPAPEFLKLIARIESAHSSICNHIQDSYNIPKACSIWIDRSLDRNMPFQEKHVIQQASILGNLERVGALKFSANDLIEERVHCINSAVDFSDAPAVVEFGAGRGYLTQMLADCCGISKVFLVERKSYKLKADRSLRQKESLMLERLRIDIEDLNLNGLDPLRGLPYLAIGKHLCGPATDMTLRCCVGGQRRDDVADCTKTCQLRGLAIATCCHHLCQWKHYINKSFFLDLGMTKEDFHAITWFTSWAVDADHGSDLSDVVESGPDIKIIVNEKQDPGSGWVGVDYIARNMSATERALLGFMCKDIIDAGRLMWMREHGLECELVRYVPSNISPENHLLIARSRAANNK